MICHLVTPNMDEQGPWSASPAGNPQAHFGVHEAAWQLYCCAVISHNTVKGIIGVIGSVQAVIAAKGSCHGCLAA